MKKILRLFRPLLKLNIEHPFLVVGFSLILAVLGGYYAIQLKIDTDIANLLPKDNPNVLALEKLKDTVGGETEMQVAIKSPSFEANKRFAEALIPKTLELYYPRYEDTYFSGVEFQRDTESIKNNALYLASEQELDDVIDWLQDEITTAKEDANPFLIDFGDDFEDEEEEVDEDKAAKFQESYEMLVPSEYPVNEDSTIMVVKFYPTGSKSDIKYLEDMFVAYQELIDSLDPASFHPEMEVRFGGRLKRHLEELTSIMDDVIGSFASGISGVIVLVMLYFFVKKYLHYRKGKSEELKHSIWSHVLRIPVPVLIIGLPLVMSLVWTFGLTYFYLGMLNTMTSVLFVILFGLGIDYGIHYYARYIELRSSGYSVEDAIYQTNDKTGEAIFVSAFTTAAALYVLMFADFRGFSEFGFISGTGIILALFAMLYVLPSLLVIFEKFNWVLFSKKEEHHVVQTKRYPLARFTVVLGLTISALVIGFSGSLGFEYNFGKLEPTFPEYEEFRRVAGQVGETSKRNPAYIIADSDEEVEGLVEVLNRKIEADTTSPTVESVEALQDRFPSTEEEENAKLQKIARVRELLQDPVLVNKDDEELDKLRLAAQTKEPLTIDQIPDYLKSRFITKDGEVGRFVIIYPSVGLSDGKKSIAFKDDIGSVELDNGKTYYAGSTSIVAANMLDLMRTESPYMVGATFIIIYLFMLFTFRSFRWSVIAMLPLVVGLLWLFGIMMVFDIQFNFYNLVVLPAILGIGEDSGVHLAHRYREEGRNSMWQVLSSTGQHITMGSVTTMLGFAGLLFTSHPGLQSIGVIAVLGIGMTLLTSLTFLPALIQWLEDKNWIRF
ncbi:efflux RND transporter permease subunit [Balneola vulgaris]|uniref:efflux RND transporter permease subunit n=1 Tax=Balneola vulgaris TaxID=287535 RepID=UPI00037D18ED|nr:MMPL family transporter [Balneola vulgaris]